MNGANEFIPTDKKFPGTKIAVYKVITGGYDNLKDPVYIDDEIDYYAFTDSESMQPGKAWKIISVPERLSGLSNTKKNRYMKA